jgi:Holliday junction DNA helicase RuvA
MIGRLRGVVAEVGEEEAIVDCGGVGYVVRAGARTLSRLPALGEEALLHVESTWSEAQGLRLFGFGTREEKAAFAILTGIQGVGPKAAMAVLDVLAPGELAAAVAREDKAAVGRANGVGPKLAIRIITELKGKPLGGGLVGHNDFAPASPAAPAPPSISGDATAALMGLGVAEPLARRAVDHALLRLGEDAALPDLIKAALQETAR